MKTSGKIFFIQAWSEESLLFDLNWHIEIHQFVPKNSRNSAVNRAFSIIFVEMSGHELRTVWRRSKLKNKVWHSRRYIRDTSRFLKGHTNKLKYVTVLFTKQHVYCTLWKNSCSFSRDLATRIKHKTHREHSKRSEGISEAISKEISKTISKEISNAFSPENILAISRPNFPQFEVHFDGNAGSRWKKWLGRFGRLTIGITISDEKQKRALLLHNGGPEVDEIFDTLQDDGEDKDYEKAVEKLTTHFSPRVNVMYEVYTLRQAKQKDGETLDCFSAQGESHGGIRHNFSQSCEKRTHQVAFIVSALIRRRCDRTN